jgi:hypothetical protein
MMVPPPEAATLEVVKAKLALEVLVHPLGSPALFDDTYGLLAREPNAGLFREPEDVMLCRR